jgi:hypothetical protein
MTLEHCLGREMFETVVSILLKFFQILNRFSYGKLHNRNVEISTMSNFVREKKTTTTKIQQTKQQQQKTPKVN